MAPDDTTVGRKPTCNYFTATARAASGSQVGQGSTTIEWRGTWGRGMPTTFGRTDNVRDGVSGRSPNRQFLAPVGVLAGAF